MFDEATLEKITMELLTNLGYETLNGYELERKNYSNVILEDDLENAITKLNINITNEDIKEVIRLIKNLDNNNTILNNKQFTQYLLEGIKVPIQEDGATRYKTIKIIDFNNIEINTFKAIIIKLIKDNIIKIRLLFSKIVSNLNTYKVNTITKYKNIWPKYKNTFDLINL